jgi:biotin carboxyl carrier protein
VRCVILREGREIPVEVHERAGGYLITLDGHGYEVDSRQVVPGLYSLIVGGRSYEVTVFSPEPEHYRVHLYDGMRTIELLSPIGLVLRSQGGGSGSSGLAVRAPMPGKVVRVLVSPGQKVTRGQGVVVVEAMKMQNELKAQVDGVVKEVLASEGDGVEGGADLVILESAE